MKPDNYTESCAVNAADNVGKENKGKCIIRNIKRIIGANSIDMPYCHQYT